MWLIAPASGAAVAAAMPIATSPIPSTCGRSGVLHRGGEQRAAADDAEVPADAEQGEQERGRGRAPGQPAGADHRRGRKQKAARFAAAVARRFSAAFVRSPTSPGG